MIYYLGHYSCEQIAAEKRIAAPPAMNKMGYVISALSRIGDGELMVVSPCETSADGYVKGGIHELDDHVTLKTFDSFRSKNKLIRIFGHMLTKAQLFHFLLTHIKADDTLIVYHSLTLMGIVKTIKKIKRCRLIIEVEELYSDVKEDEALRKKELGYLQVADKYIVITELLSKEIDPQNKPKVISHGTYRTIPCYSDRASDGKIHVVYAGSFNPVKGGACSAVDAAQFLDDSYVLHILGKGSPADTDTVVKKIQQVSQKANCQIVFDGYKTGKEFDNLIQSCHIGLSTQQPDGKYNASSFPSKILMYMSNGLPVVSVRIPAVEGSQVGDLIYYYDDPVPEKIADAIRSVPVDNCMNVRGRLDKLNEKFILDLTELLVQ